MNSEEIYYKFLEIEEKFNLFEIKIENRLIWQYVRLAFLDKIVWNMTGIEITCKPGKNLEQKPEKRLTKIINDFKTNPYLVAKKDLVFIGYQRRVFEDGYYIDYFTERLLQELDNSFYLFEDLYRGIHFKPVKVKNLKYIDNRVKFHGDKPNSTSAEVKKKANFLFHLFQREVGIAWSNREKNDLLRIINNIVNGYRDYILFCQFLLNRIQPKVIIVVVGYDIKQMIMIREAKKKSIPVIELQHGRIGEHHLSYNFLSKRNLEVFPDYIFTFGDLDKLTPNYPIANNHIISVGYPELEYQLQKYKDLNLKTNKKQITFFASDTPKLAAYALHLFENLNPMEYKITYKLHPSEYGCWRQKYPDLIKSNIEVVDNNKHSVYYYLAKSDFVVGCVTTVMYEAVMFECAIYIIKESEYWKQKELYKNGLATLVETKEELLKDLRANRRKQNIDSNYVFKKNAIENMKLEIARIKRIDNIVKEIKK